MVQRAVRRPRPPAGGWRTLGTLPHLARGEQLGALGIVFSALDADGVMIIEGPDTNGRRSTVRALENFARAYGLRARSAITALPRRPSRRSPFFTIPTC
jgi:hypothetical protein